eukprot:GHUV01057996.1.p1 GENE.GHUV01057996.1~~GHUV01057996.1.p1  ORF type:complete len:147 (+),score=20.69 GHUV01057996.1:490-930(+)
MPAYYNHVSSVVLHCNLPMYAVYHRNSADIANMAHGTEKFQNTVSRANQIQKCFVPEFANYSACSNSSMTEYLKKFTKNIEQAASYHSMLYLGQTGLKTFSDRRLMEYWTYDMLPEQRYYNYLLEDNGTLAYNAVVLSHRPLWELG